MWHYKRRDRRRSDRYDEAPDRRRRMEEHVRENTRYTGSADTRRRREAAHGYDRNYMRGGYDGGGPSSRRNYDPRRDYGRSSIGYDREMDRGGSHFPGGYEPGRRRVGSADRGYGYERYPSREGLQTPETYRSRDYERGDFGRWSERGGYGRSRRFSRERTHPARRGW